MDHRSVSLDELAAWACDRAGRGGRHLLGVTGAPGSGKSTVARALVDAVGPAAALVPMDGFHLADEVLAAAGLADRKGAPETVDAAGFVALLRRLRDRSADVVYAPAFRRELEMAEAGAIPVAPAVRLVVVEGNYLLLGDGPWAAVRDLLDETWFLQVPDEVRRGRLLARHRGYGRSEREAREWVERVDEANAVLVAATAPRADLTVVPDGP